VATTAKARSPGTAKRILDTAEKLVQVRGFNAFSYADIAKALGIQKASLHHHFATKADLGHALVTRYRQDFLGALAHIEDESADAAERIERYADLYGSVLRKKRMCLCGMLAADVATLPKAMRDSVAEFFTENELWLTRILDAGRSAGELEFDESATSMAAFFISSLEGAMLLARGSGNVGHFDSAARRLLAGVRPKSSSPT
jgi:TetR/AcrR family transcriptional regulator, transcriptional repressor for nem operon